MDFSDALPLLAISATAVGLAAAAIAIASALGLDRRWFGRVAARTPHDTINRLAALADMAKSEGLLTAEGTVDRASEPLLAQGLRLAVDGVAPEEISRQLNDSLDAAGTRSLWPGRLLGMLGLSQAHAIAAAALFAVMLANRFEPELTPPLTATLAVVAFLVLAAAGCIAASVHRGSAGEASSVLNATMQIVGATLIGSGCDGRAVRGHLSSLLPPSQRAREAISQAA